MALKQKTLFGGTAIKSTYYNHEPKSRFEKFIEASFFFNKDGKTKEEFYKSATKEWTNKKDSEEIEKLIQKYEQAKGKSNQIKSKKINHFFKRSPASKSIAQTTIPEKQDIQDRVKGQGQDRTVKVNVPIPSSSSSETTLLEDFLETLKKGLREFMETTRSEKMLQYGLEALAKTFFFINYQMNFIKENSIRQTKSTQKRKCVARKQTS